MRAFRRRRRDRSVRPRTKKIGRRTNIPVVAIDEVIRIRTSEKGEVAV